MPCRYCATLCAGSSESSKTGFVLSAKDEPSRRDQQNPQRDSDRDSGTDATRRTKIVLKIVFDIRETIRRAPARIDAVAVRLAAGQVAARAGERKAVDRAHASKITEPRGRNGEMAPDRRYL
jgi:hypothetical protein